METNTPTWKTSPWFLSSFNRGVEICYVDSQGYSRPIPLYSGDDGHCPGYVGEYLIQLHNRGLGKTEPRTFMVLICKKTGLPYQGHRTNADGTITPENYEWVSVREIVE
jgi:hypothetical protein